MESLLGPLCGLCKLGDCSQEVVRHILCPKRRAEMLRTRMNDLNSYKENTRKAVAEKTTEQPWSEMHPDVNTWILSVEALSARVDDITRDMPFWKRFCCCHTYNVGDKIQQYLEEIQDRKQTLAGIRGDLVVDASSIHDLKIKLHKEMEELRDAKKNLEFEVQGLEMQAVFPPNVRSKRVESWIEKFNSLEAEVSVSVANNTVVTPNEAAAVSRNEATVAVAPNEAAATTAATVAKRKGDIWEIIHEVEKLSEQLTRLKQEGELVVAAPPKPFHELPGNRSDFVVGIKENLTKAETLLNDGKMEVILIHGMGGSGKTTLVRELTKELRSKGGNGFDFIFSVVVSRNLDIHKIQGDILVQLGYRRDDQSLPLDIDDRSMFLEEKLNKKSFLLILDDLWEPLGDLPSKLGFKDSSSSPSKKCKVVVTSRKANVCEGIEFVAALKIGLLEKEHAWELFCRKSDLVQPDEHICTLAKEIVEKCGGLPLLLKTVASAMVKNRNYDDWFSAKNQLNKYPDAIRNMDQVYERLKFSFDMLENDGLRVCLLYCALFPEDYNIPVDELIPYLIAEGFVDGRYDFDFNTLWHKARHDIIEKLKESSLLERGETSFNGDDSVKLHDAVREMLLSLDHDWKVLNSLEKRCDGRIDVDSWDGVRMASVLHSEDIEKIVRGEATLSSLRTLLVRLEVTLSCVRTLLVYDLPISLFPHFSSLRILDLSGYSFLSEIPKSIGSLKSLLYLSLKGTRVKELPVEIGNLTNLHTLDLSWTYDLYEIPRDAISPLKMLQSLNLFNCYCFKDEKEGMLKVVDVSTQLPKLKDVGLSLFGTIDVAERLFPLNSQLSLHKMHIDEVMSSKFLKLQWLKKLQIYHCTIALVEFLHHENLPQLKSVELSSVRSRNIILKSPYWCLQELRVSGCHELKHLGWIRHLPNLTELFVESCDNLQELVPKDMSEKNKDESSCRYDDPTILLSKLKVMKLEDLPKLESISSGNLPFPCLTDMTVDNCPRIRSLPIKSSNSVRTRIICQKEWWESLEWEDDECNSSRFIQL